jgi:hypothetical protein
MLTLGKVEAEKYLIKSQFYGMLRVGEVKWSEVKWSFYNFSWTCILPFIFFHKSDET